MVFHAADIQGVSFSIIIPVNRLESCTDKSRQGENESTVVVVVVVVVVFTLKAVPISTQYTF